MLDRTKIKLLSFDWDKGNIDKNLLKHRVVNEEAEEIFYNEPLLIFEDIRHSDNELRFVAYGITDEGRKLTAVFTVRKDKIRAISVRDMNIKERRIYEKA